MKSIKVALTTLVTGAGFLGMAFFSPVSAAGVYVVGNGSFSDNIARINMSSVTNVSQTNDSDFTNNVSVNNNTGNNTANGNTGGDTSITTGDTNANVSIHNMAGMNAANVSGNNNTNPNIDVAGNGSFSNNAVNFSNNNRTTVDQNNTTNIDNNVNIRNNTGNNTANGNTGSFLWNPWSGGFNNSGNTDIQTGNANADVSITNTAGYNEANVSGNSNNGNTNIAVEENGAFSHNKVDFRNNQSTNINQNNNSNFDNNVNIHNNTGYNTTGGNTGFGFNQPWFNRFDNGNNQIDTGNADAYVHISNQAGRNVANVYGNNSDSVNVDIFRNGAYSRNNVSYHNNKFTNSDQNNDTYFNNYVDVKNKTGYNNTGSSDRYQQVYPRYLFTMNYPDMKSYDNRRDYIDYHNKPFISYPDKDYYNSYFPKHNYLSDSFYKEYPKYFEKYDKEKYDNKYHNYYPVLSYNKDYDHGYKNYGMKYDHNSYKKDYDHVKFSKYYPVKDDSYNKNYDHYYPYQPVSYHKDYSSELCNGKYYPVKFSYMHQADSQTYMPYYPVKNFYPVKKHDNGNKYGLYKHDNYQKFAYNQPFRFFPKFYGNSGNTSVHTGGAFAKVHLNNLASANYFRN